MFLNILIITFILLTIATAGMAVSILLRKKGRFPAYRVGHNRDMHKMGLRCAKDEEIRCYRKELEMRERKDKGCDGCQQIP